VCAWRVPALYLRNRGEHAAGEIAGAVPELGRWLVGPLTTATADKDEEFSMSYSISAIEEIGVDDADKLRAVGIRTAEKLLEAAKSPSGRRQLAGKTKLDEKRLLRWANIADKLRIRGMGKEYAGLLREVGVDTVKELRYRNPSKLAKSMAETNKRRKLVRFLPSEKLVQRWVEQAKKLPQKITY
jgi:predicted RecB family nuclease